MRIVTIIVLLLGLAGVGYYLGWFNPTSAQNIVFPPQRVTEAIFCEKSSLQRRKILPKPFHAHGRIVPIISLLSAHLVQFLEARISRFSTRCSEDFLRKSASPACD